MLTEPQYLALRKYRDSFVSAAGKPDDMTVYLCRQGFIEIKRTEYTINSECQVSYLKTFWEVTALGNQALEEFEEHINVMRNERAIKKADRKFQLVNTFLGAVIGAVVTLFIEHFAEIFEFFHKSFT